MNRILSIVLPALNEEGAIGDTIRRCLAARADLMREGAITDMELIVVSDGSTDHTEEIARAFCDVKVLAFNDNRGYGAALKSGFDHARGDLLGFLDADGTCDPRVFESLCRAIEEQEADIALGSRMGPGNKMPWVRVVGNALFARMLGLLSKQRVSDTASGMRVLRRHALDHLYPLPDGLHFTPAMSARALLEGRLKLVEVPMSYVERVGRSKLSAFRDGVRFLSTIVQAAMCYRPARPLLIVATLLALLAFGAVLLPASHYLHHGRLEEWMVYRILASSLLTTMAGFLVCVSVVAERIAAAAHGRSFASAGVTALVSKLFVSRVRWIAGLGLTMMAVIIVLPGIAEYVATGYVQMHWSRAMFASLLLLIAAMLALTIFILKMMDLIDSQRLGKGIVHKPDRLRGADAPSQ